MKNRYPGIQSFQEDDEQLFYGRKKEIKALLGLMLAQPIVVLFSKSGMGKTSLLQAGVLPRLRFSEYDPILLRLNQLNAPLEKQVLRYLYFGHNSDAATTLWEEVKRYNRERGNGVPLLIFDQFEEIFTLYDLQMRSVFIRQLADLINLTMPVGVREQLKKDIAAGKISDAEVLELEKPPLFKIVLSIRSDLLHFLHQMSSEIPTILRNRFELTGLKPDQAKEAIEKPAALSREYGNYASPAFAWSPAALEQILAYLCRQESNLLTGTAKEPEVESFQLQLLCEQIEKMVTASITNKDGLVITPDFYGGEKGIKRIISDYYKNAIASIDDPMQRSKAQRFIEDRLVQNARRVSVDELTCKQTFGVFPDTLAHLVDFRLLRRDPRETGNYYEVSHDTLLEPILASKARFEAQESERRAKEAEAEADEARHKAAEERTLRERAQAHAIRARRFTLIAAALALAAIGISIWAYSLKNMTKSTLNKLETSNEKVLKLILSNANDDIWALDYEAALDKAKATTNVDAPNKETLKILLEIAFWHCEAGHINRATGILDTTAVLVKDMDVRKQLEATPKEVAIARKYLRDIIKSIDSVGYDSLMERYYPVMVAVKGGTFDLGCQPSENPDCEADEVPYTMTLGDYELSQYETSWWQYFLFCKATNHDVESPGWGLEGDNPGVNINWFDAAMYSNWLNKQFGLDTVYVLENKKQVVVNAGDASPVPGSKTVRYGDFYEITTHRHGRSFRLPLEAEWEFAAKGRKVKDPFLYSGSNVVDSVAWYRANSKKRTRQIGQKKANALGLYDMSGNVWEWCQDDWYASYKKGYGDGLVLKDKSQSEYRVMRGGSWNYNDKNSRATNRLRDKASVRYVNIGFRLAR